LCSGLWWCCRRVAVRHETMNVLVTSRRRALPAVALAPTAVFPQHLHTAYTKHRRLVTATIVRPGRPSSCAARRAAACMPPGAAGQPRTHPPCGAQVLKIHRLTEPCRLTPCASQPDTETIGLRVVSSARPAPHLTAGSMVLRRDGCQLPTRSDGPLSWKAAGDLAAHLGIHLQTVSAEFGHLGWWFRLCGHLHWSVGIFSRHSRHAAPPVHCRIDACRKGHAQHSLVLAPRHIWDKEVHDRLKQALAVPQC